MPGADPNFIVYGGAFDPPHAAHVDCVRRALARFPAARVLVMPAAAPAVAGSVAPKAAVASFEDRAAMTALAFAPLGPRVALSHLEAELPAPNYTVNTLRALRTRFPEARLGLLLGADQLASFSRWRDPQDILRLATLIAVGRDGADPEPGFSPVITLEGWPPPAESRKIRTAIAAGEPVPDGWLTPGVRQYIEKRRLYAQHEDT